MADRENSGAIARLAHVAHAIAANAQVAYFQTGCRECADRLARFPQDASGSLLALSGRVQRNIERLIGRLATDEDFRSAFQRNPQQTLIDAADWGLDLSAIEVDAMLATDQKLWDRIAAELDSRLQKASLKTT